MNFNYVPIAEKNINPVELNLAGSIAPLKDVEFKPAFEKKSGAPIQIHPDITRLNYQEILATHLKNATDHWLIIPESYHVDWTASANGKSILVCKAFGSLLAVKVPPDTNEITFSFQPPKWYSQFLTISLIAWLLTLSACATSFIVDRFAKKK